MGSGSDTGLGIKTEAEIENERVQGMVVNKTGTKRKQSRKIKEDLEITKNLKEQNKFFIDVSKETEMKEMIFKLLEQSNSKAYGREIILKDLVIVALPKLTSKDIEKIQEGCLSGMEKVERSLDEHNKKNDQKLTLEEFLVKKLNIS